MKTNSDFYHSHFLEELKSASQLNKTDKIYVTAKEGKVIRVLEDKKIFNVSAVIAFTRGKQSLRARVVYERT